MPTWAWVLLIVFSCAVSVICTIYGVLYWVFKDFLR